MCWHILRNLVILMFLALLLLPGCRRESPQLVIGRNPITQATMHERQSELVGEWSSREYRKRILLHISPLDDLEYVPDSAMKEIRRLYRDRQSDELAKKADHGAAGLFASRNTVFAAAKAGGFKEVYWVIPYKAAEMAGGGLALKNFLKTVPSFTDHEAIERMKLDGGCLAGTVNGIKLRICSPNSLPKFDEPVVISISGDFFRVFAAEQQVSSLRSMRLLLNALVSRSIQAASVHVVVGVEEGGMLPFHRYICDEFVEGIVNPQIFDQEAAPPLWQARDRAENMLNGGERQLVRDEVAKAIKKFPDDHPLLQLDIAAQLLMGDAAGALVRAKKLVATEPADRNRGGSQFLVQLGDMAGETQSGSPEPFYRAALELHPRWPYALGRFAGSLLERGKYVEAREAFKELASVRDSFLLRLRRGDVAYLLGDNAEAVRLYDSARTLYNEKIGIPISRENVLSLDRMIRLYAQVGRAKEADDIEQWKKRMDIMRPVR